MVADLFGWSPETWTAVGTLALATVTALALASSPLRRRRERARLHMEIRKEPPDTHMIAMTDSSNPSAPVVLGNALYVRIRVSHVGGKAAENAELLAAKLWQITDQKQIVSRRERLPAPPRSKGWRWKEPAKQTGGSR